MPARAAGPGPVEHPDGERFGNRPVFAPETPERRASKRGGLDKSALKSLAFFVERSLGKVFDKI